MFSFPFIASLPYFAYFASLPIFYYLGAILDADSPEPRLEYDWWMASSLSDNPLNRKFPKLSMTLLISSKVPCWSGCLKETSF